MYYFISVKEKRKEESPKSYQQCFRYVRTIPGPGVQRSKIFFHMQSNQFLNYSTTKIIFLNMKFLREYLYYKKIRCENRIIFFFFFKNNITNANLTAKNIY